MNGVYGSKYGAAYNATKEAIRGLTRTLANEWGRYNVTVNVVLPSSMSPSYAAFYRDDPKKAEAVAKLNPMRRHGRALEDIGSAVLGLVADHARFITRPVAVCGWRRQSARTAAAALRRHCVSVSPQLWECSIASLSSCWAPTLSAKESPCVWRREGARVAVLDEDAAKGHAVAEALANAHAESFALQVELRGANSAPSIRIAVEQIARRFGGVYALINNVLPVPSVAPLEGQTADIFNEAFARVQAAVVAMQAVLPFMRGAGGDRIINVGPPLRRKR